MELLRVSQGVVGLLLSGAGGEGGDAKGFCVDGGDGGVVEDGDVEGFGIDGGEGKCPFIGTLEGVCVMVLCGDGEEGWCAFVGGLEGGSVVGFVGLLLGGAGG